MRTDVDAWMRSAEQIAVAQAIQGTRLLGLVSPTRASGVSRFARMIAEAMGQSRLKVLLAQISSGEDDIVMSAANALTEPWHAIRSDPSYPIDIIAANVTPQTKHIFNNSDWLRSFFAEKLRSYSNIVLDLPAIMDTRPDQVTALAPASICDAVILVCATGEVTRPQLDQSLLLLRSVEARVSGLVVNEDGTLSGAEELTLTKAAALEGRRPRAKRSPGITG